MNADGNGAAAETDWFTAATRVDAPDALTATAGTPGGRVALSWTFSGSDGYSAITRWEYGIRTCSNCREKWHQISNSLPTTRSRTVTGLVGNFLWARGWFWRGSPATTAG